MQILALTFYSNDQTRANELAAEFGDSLGKSIVGGVRLFEGAHKYLNGIGAAGYEGDYTKVFRDIGKLGESLDKAWQGPSHRRKSSNQSLNLVQNLQLMGSLVSVQLNPWVRFLLHLPKMTDTIASDAQRLHKVGKRISDKPVKAIKEVTDQLVDSIRQKDGLRLAHATAYGDDIGTINAAEDVLDSLHVFEKRRLFTSKYDSTHRLTPIEAARENARLKGADLDEDAWKKLTPKEKAAQLEKDGYELIEDPDKPRPIVDSSKLNEAHRGDRMLYAEYDSEGFKKAHINSDGNLIPSNPDGKYKGRDVKIIEHILESADREVKAESPFISVGTKNVVMKYGEGRGLAIDMKGLRKAIASGEVTGVEIIEHQELLDYINDLKGYSKFDKTMAFRFARFDNEFLLKGIVPKRFLKELGD